MKRLSSLFAMFLFCSATAYAGQSLSEASVAIPAASGVVILGSMSVLAASAVVTVKSVEVVGDGAVIVLNGASDMASASVKLSAQAAKGLSLTAGTVVNVAAVSTGHVLVAGGKAIAFIPNEIGTALLHQSKVQ
jgi:hypothetical protein